MQGVEAVGFAIIGVAAGPAPSKLRTDRRRARAAAVLALSLMLASAALDSAAQRARPGRPGANPDADNDAMAAAMWCLPARPSANDHTVMLRVAMPPMDERGGMAIFQALFMRLVASGGVGGAAASPGLAAVSSFGQSAQPLSPLTTLVFDSAADVLAARYGAAEQGLGRCRQLAQEQGDSLAEAACANNLAVAHAAQGRPVQARAELERALGLYESPRQAPANPHALVPGGLPFQLPPQQLREMGLVAWRRTERLMTQRGLERTWLNLGNLALATGRASDAEQALRRAFDNRAADENVACRVAAAVDLARLHRRLGRPGESAALLARHRLPPRAEDDFSLFDLGTVALAGAADVAGPGSHPSSAPGVTVAAAPAMPAMPAMPAPTRGQRPTNEVVLGMSAFGEPEGRFGEAALAELAAVASRASAAPGDGQRMASAYRLALRAQAGARPDLAYAAHAALMRLHRAQGNGAMVVLHGKLATNFAQATRAQLADGSPSRDSRRAFLRERRQLYAALAQLLLDQQRLLEAEAAIQLLKEDEGQQFLSGSVAEAIGRMPLTNAEREWQQQEEAAAARLAQAERERVAASHSGVLGGGMLAAMRREQIELARMRLALALLDQPAVLKRRPLVRPPPSEPAMQAALPDLRAFLLGPDQRLERFLEHLIDDAKTFKARPSAAELAQLDKTLRSVKALQSELAPLLANAALVDGPIVTRSTLRPGERESGRVEVEAWGYLGAEPLERAWRSILAADAIEDQHVAERARRAPAPLLAAADRAADVAALEDETRQVLSEQSVPTTLLYYLPDDTRLDVMMVSAKGRRHWRLDVPRAELDAQVGAFIDVLRNEAVDPRPAARALYARLFAPVAQAVTESGAQVLALSLAERLRFVPFAALHDGQAWLVERYALAVHPGGALKGRLKPASGAWRVAAFGASKGGGKFSALPNVPRELAGVARTERTPGGALPGQAWLDGEFTAERLRTALAARPPVLHIASHFEFARGDAQGSHLLLGDGSTLSLHELASSAYRLERTELVTLSACRSGLSADDLYGQEVDGLAALLMGQGASAVLASMWDVNDASTAQLMASFYRLRESRHLSRAVAVQQAQIAMIRSAAVPTPGPARRAGPTRDVIRVPVPGAPAPPPAEHAATAAESLGESLGHGHPFHWAPFVLMGNWR